MPDSLTLRRQIRALAEPSITHLGFDLVAVDWTGDHGRSIVLYIDRPGGVDAHACGEAVKRVGPVLEESGLILGDYRLEVSSPGIDRPMETRDDFARFIGFSAKIKLVEGSPRRRYTGQLLSLKGDDLMIEVDGTEHRIALESIERANLVLTLEQYASLAVGLPPVPEQDGGDLHDQQ